MGRKKLNQGKLSEQFSRQNMLVFLLRKYNQLRIREFIKKFVDWCDEIYTF